MPTPFRLLTVNAGSSSVRLEVFGADTRAAALATRHCEGTDLDPPALLRELLATQPTASHWAVAHRVVHGGARLPGRCEITREVEQEIAALATLAPLHNPPALRWIRACRETLGGDARQFAVFDTGYYRDLPAVAQTYALPGALRERHHLRRYGFHGLAHHAMVRRWTSGHPGLAAQARVISLQLGSGCSVTASRGGHAIDTSMGFSPLEGLVMATRAGDLDPGLLLYLLRDGGLDLATLDRMLSHEAGLKGLAGRADMRELLAADDADARLAVALYCYRARKYVGACLAALGGADALLFGGGVGEHAPAVRAAILADMAWAGIVLDAAANDAARGADALISRADSRVEVRVVAVDEARELADAARALHGV